MTRTTRRTVIKGLAAAPVTGAALLARPAWGLAQNGEPVVVGSKNFPEQLILGEMYAQLLEEAGIPIERSLNLGSTAIAHSALVEGEIDLYPEYTGTGLNEILGIPIAEVQEATPEGGMASPMAGMATPMAGGTPMAGASPAAGSIDERVFQIVADEYRRQFDLVWLDQTAFNNTQAIGVTREFSDERGITTISQLAEIAGDLTIVAPSDFAEREDGALGLERAYGIQFGDTVLVDPGVRYQALQDGQADVVLAFGTDGQVSALDLVLLEDDRGLWPPYHVAPVVRQETLDANPALAETLNALAPLLTDEVMSALNYRVEGPDREDPADVAQAFLEENGLLSE